MTKWEMKWCYIFEPQSKHWDLESINWSERSKIPLVNILENLCLERYVQIIIFQDEAIAKYYFQRRWHECQADIIRIKHLFSLILLVSCENSFQTVTYINALNNPIAESSLWQHEVHSTKIGCSKSSLTTIFKSDSLAISRSIIRDFLTRPNTKDEHSCK